METVCCRDSERMKHRGNLGDVVILGPAKGTVVKCQVVVVHVRDNVLDIFRLHLVHLHVLQFLHGSVRHPIRLEHANQVGFAVLLLGDVLKRNPPRALHGLYEPLAPPPIPDFGHQLGGGLGFAVELPQVSFNLPTALGRHQLRDEAGKGSNKSAAAGGLLGLSSRRLFIERLHPAAVFHLFEPQHLVEDHGVLPTDLPFLFCLGRWHACHVAHCALGASA
mmetsp:Transcript_2056/g.4649  ORF Transcript_2056/g.4649 Transcript_2056/m.4649 type:complete len:221 (+) Transcript_2056:321-983(+)